MTSRHRRHDDDDPLAELIAEHMKAYGPKSGYVFNPPAPIPAPPPGRAPSGMAESPASDRQAQEATIPLPPPSHAPTPPPPPPTRPPRTRPTLAYSRPVWTPGRKVIAGQASPAATGPAKA